ncbi:MAG: HD domain-containing protein [Lachnospiraceae bacterium]|nr:HD domain-containing protein [Ruminococcus sp.]MCM1275593.1 HD domain-containing protein [Lachnospiraceae bacterium]
MELPFQIAEMLERLERAGFSAFVVGGCVRDALMGMQPRDYDITTSALPRETERVFSDCRVIETGVKHGTVTVLYKGQSVEITTFRVDGEYADGRHPSSVTFSREVGDDLSRRDFTMNGIAYSPKTGVIDPFGGAGDIGSRMIRCIGDPGRRFSEDALRILRALRFSATLGFAVEKQTADTITARAKDLHKVSAERVFSELKLLLCGSGVKRVLLEFPSVFAEIMPPLAEQIGYEQGSRYHDSTLYEHTARAVEAAPAEPALRLAMLLHDTGKPFCRTVGEDGECHYYGHAEKSREIADGLLRTLKCDNVLRERVCAIIKRHDMPAEPSRRIVKRRLSQYGSELFRDIMCAQIADSSAQSALGRPRIENAKKCLETAEEIISAKPCLTLKELAVSGRDLKDMVPPSPLMGRVLSELLAEVVAEKLPNEKNALLERAKALISSL